MTTGSGFRAHLEVALWSTLLLAASQILVETLVIALRYGPVILPPSDLFQSEVYDFSVKFLQLSPWTGALFVGGSLDRFLEVGFASKLVIANGLVLPNLLCLGVLSLFVGVMRCRLGRPARIIPILLLVTLFGLGVHLVVWPLTTDTLGHVYADQFTGDPETVVAAAILVAAAMVAVAAACIPAPARTLLLGAMTVAAGWLVLPSSPSASASPTEVTYADRNPEPAAALADNVVLISIDSLRADRLGTYGNPRDTSPAMDALASTGTRFLDARATSPWTLPSHMSMLTGRHHLSHGVLYLDDKLPDGIGTLAEQLQRIGITTLGIPSEVTLSPQYGFHRGFDQYDDTILRGLPQDDQYFEEWAPVTTDLAIGSIERNRENRFFLFVHYWDVHYDYTPPPPYDSMFDPEYRGSVTGRNVIDDDNINAQMDRRDLQHLLALYDGEIRWVDDHILRLVAALEERGLLENTAIIIASDHGDEFFEHGGKGHGATLYRETVHVPLIVRLPHTSASREVEVPVSLIDIAPTVLEIFGAPPSPEMDGLSLVPLLSGKPLGDRPGVFAFHCARNRPQCRAMLHSPVETLIYNFWPFRTELYANADFEQQHDQVYDVVWNLDERVALLQSHMERQWAAYRNAGGRRNVLPENGPLRERLRALGYLE